MCDLTVPLIIHSCSDVFVYEFLCFSPKNLIFCFLFRTLDLMEIKIIWGSSGSICRNHLTFASTSSFTMTFAAVESPVKSRERYRNTAGFMEGLIRPNLKKMAFPMVCVWKTGNCGRIDSMTDWLRVNTLLISSSFGTHQTKCMFPVLFPKEGVHKTTEDSTPVLCKLWMNSYRLLGSPGHNSLRNTCSYGCTASSVLLSSLNNGKRLLVVALTYMSVIDSRAAWQGWLKHVSALISCSAFPGSQHIELECKQKTPLPKFCQGWRFQ